MAYTEVRGPDGRLLFRFDPDRMLIEIATKGKRYVIDLTIYLPTSPAIIEIDPLASLKGCRSQNGKNAFGIEQNSDI